MRLGGGRRASPPQACGFRSRSLNSVRHKYFGSQERGMPEPLVHFIIPFFVLVSVGVKPRRAAALAALAVLPDFDVLVHTHRTFSHSFVVLLALCVPVVALLRKLRPERLRDAELAALCLLSHPFLDMFCYYTAVLWPLLDKSVWICAEALVNLSSLHVSFQFDVKLLPTRLEPPNADVPVITSTGVGVALLLLLAAVTLRSLRARRAGGRLVR
ncbi:MAG: metal-dependent hydrolase [Candidatus Alkanophagales archaeon]